MCIKKKLHGWWKKITNWTSNSKLVGDPEDPTNTKQLYQTIPIEHTPFTLVRIEHGWMVTMGKYRLDKETYTSFKDAKAAALDTDWDKMITIINICIINNQEMEKLNKTIADQQLKTKTGGHTLDDLKKEYNDIVAKNGSIIGTKTTN